MRRRVRTSKQPFRTTRHSQDPPAAAATALTVAPDREPDMEASASAPGGRLIPRSTPSTDVASMVYRVRLTRWSWTQEFQPGDPQGGHDPPAQNGHGITTHPLARMQLWRY